MSVAVLSSLALSLTACGSGSGGSPAAGDQVLDFKSCDQMPDVGKAAIGVNASKTEILRSAYFQKPYNPHYLAAVLDAASNSTTSFVASLGVTVTKASPAKQAPQSCPTYANLPEASGTIAQIWNQAAGGTTGEGSLAGLFFELCGSGGMPACDDRKMINPNIIVHRDSDRWTIVHEMMHFNFNKGRKLTPEVRGRLQLMTDLDRLQKDFENHIKAFEVLPTQIDLLNAAKALRGIAQGVHELAVMRDLEEVSIEGTLIGLWADGKLRNTGGRAPTTWYMEYSRDAALKMVDGVNGPLQKIRQMAVDNFWQAVIDEIDPAITQVASVKTEAQAAIDQAKLDLKRAAASKPNGLMAPLSYYQAEPSALDEAAHHAHVEALDNTGASEKAAEIIERINTIL